jgi:hypothetical protein
MFQLEVLIRELNTDQLQNISSSSSRAHLCTVYGFTACSIALCHIAPLRPFVLFSSMRGGQEVQTHIKFLIIRWKLDPSYPKPNSSPSSVFPVHNALKFSAVLGTVLWLIS